MGVCIGMCVFRSGGVNGLMPSVWGAFGIL